MGGVVLKNYTAKIEINESMSSGGLISCYSNTVTLKKGHKYSLSMSGSIAVSANNDNGNYSVQMKDGYDDDFCRALTRVKRDGRPIKDVTLDQYPFSFGRIYDATDRDITLRFEFEQSSYSSCLDLFNCTFTVFAID